MRPPRPQKKASQMHLRKRNSKGRCDCEDSDGGGSAEVVVVSNLKKVFALHRPMITIRPMKASLTICKNKGKTILIIITLQFKNPITHHIDL